MKIVNLYEYMPVLQDILKNEQKSVSFTVTGSSMNPFLIHERDSVVISPVKRRLKKGDIIFFTRKSGQYVMHRIHHIKDGQLYVIGDAQTEMEGPVAPSQVFGLITQVIRKGKVIRENNFWWFFFAHIWLHMIPLRRMIMKLYGRRSQ